ncbi:MAG: tRNA pseudouridine(55) synthase TruB [Alphaproteobacteria bacterium]|nr:tRNA pseudouridine(55) synthase TruB [Alphaproteobacteria bacterium]
MSDGWIILDKASGVFSKSAAARVARIFGTKKNGHIGTLDPMASGVLPIALGKATKMVPFIEEYADRAKEYLFSVKFGFETDTLDITGKEIKRTNVVPSIDLVQRNLSKFIGKISQIPPIYSAVHIDGCRAYELARKGEIPEIPPRIIEVHLLELLDSIDDTFNFRMICAPGTYVRSIARDLAYACGTFATVTMICRTSTSGFKLKNAVGLDFLENLFNNGTDVSKYLAPVDFGLGDIPVLNLNDQSVNLYRNGGFIGVASADGIYRVYSEKEFIGIGTVSSGVLRPKRTI